MPHGARGADDHLGHGDLVHGGRVPCPAPLQVEAMTMPPCSVSLSFDVEPVSRLVVAVPIVAVPMPGI